MKDILKEIDPTLLGQELQNARTQRGLTQAEAAKIIDVARTTLTAIEKGDRPIKVILVVHVLKLQPYNHNFVVLIVPVLRTK
jgi:DNA-binding XRE family transcriptional regulator